MATITFPENAAFTDASARDWLGWRHEVAFVDFTMLADRMFAHLDGNQASAALCPTLSSWRESKRIGLTPSLTSFSWRTS